MSFLGNSGNASFLSHLHANPNSTNALGQMKHTVNQAYENDTGATPTSGDWTSEINYNPSLEKMRVQFRDGFVAEYDNIPKDQFLRIQKGTATTSLNPNRSNSTGAALHAEGIAARGAPYRRVDVINPAKWE